jgi:hypothetical protein
VRLVLRIVAGQWRELVATDRARELLVANPSKHKRACVCQGDLPNSCSGVQFLCRAFSLDFLDHSVIPNCVGHIPLDDHTGEIGAFLEVVGGVLLRSITVQRPGENASVPSSRNKTLVILRPVN